MRTLGAVVVVFLIASACGGSSETSAPNMTVAPTTTAAPTTTTSQLKPIIIDVHSHLAPDVTTDLVISALNQGVVDAMVMFARNPSTDAEVLGLADALPGRVVAGLAFQQQDWMLQEPWVLQEIARKLETGRYHWLGEVILRHYGAPVSYTHLTLPTKA